MKSTPDVIRLGSHNGPMAAALADVLRPYGLVLEYVAPTATIPGSYWGESEAGLIGHRLLVRDDTPVHSALHEACHFICADAIRRVLIAIDAGGDDLEECAVCYLSILLAGTLPEFGRARMLADMDAWGYSFRLGSARDWFAEDAVDARDWLLAQGVIDNEWRPTGRCAGGALNRPIGAVLSSGPLFRHLGAPRYGDER